MTPFTYRQLFIALGILFVFAFKPAEKPFQGIITYSIDYLEVPESIEGLESMLPSDIQIHFKDHKTAIEQSVMGGSQKVIVDSEDSTSFILMNMLGQKICIELSKEELRETSKGLKAPTITYQKETKKVLGYKCKMATITQDSTVTTVFYTKELNVPKHKDFNQLDGFPLEYETYSNGMKLHMLATDIEEKTLDHSYFSIPDDYTRMTMDEMQHMMGNK